MLDKVEKVFPEALPVVQHQPVALRLLILIIILALPTALLIIWSPLKNLLLQGNTIQIPIRLLAVIVFTTLVFTFAVFVALAPLRRRARLRAFVRQWIDMRERIMLLHAKIESWNQPDGGIEGLVEIADYIHDYATHRIPLRRLLFLLGEKTLVLHENQRWRELKAKQAVFKERDYLTPFSFLLDLEAPIYNVHFHGSAIWAALFISDDYIEHLRYKYPFLEKAAAQQLVGSERR